MTETYINKSEKISESNNFIGFVYMNKLQDITNNTKTLFIELGLSSYDEYIWYHFPSVWKYIYNLTDDVLISGEPKFGKDKPRQWNILQVFPEILDFIKESYPKEYNYNKVVRFIINPETHVINITNIVETSGRNISSKSIGGIKITKM